MSDLKKVGGHAWSNDLQIMQPSDLVNRRISSFGALTGDRRSDRTTSDTNFNRVYERKKRARDLLNLHGVSVSDFCLFLCVELKEE